MKIQGQQAPELSNSQFKMRFLFPTALIKLPEAKGIIKKVRIVGGDNNPKIQAE